MPLLFAVGSWGFCCCGSRGTMSPGFCCCWFWSAGLVAGCWAGACAWAATTKNERIRTTSGSRLFLGSIVTRFEIQVQLRQALRRDQLDLNLAPFAVAHWISWTVAEHVLVAQLDAYLCRYVRQFIDVIDGKSPATGHVGHLAQQLRAGALFRAL